jgi:hypothetical protein
VGADHVLAAILEKPDASVTGLFERCGVAIAAIRGGIETLA